MTSLTSVVWGNRSRLFSARAVLVLGIALVTAPTLVLAETQVRGTPKAVSLDTKNASVEEILVALTDAFDVQFRSSANLEASISRTLVLHLTNAICSRLRFEDGGNDMADEHRTWRRQDEGFWRAHHEAWKCSDLNQRQYCDVHGLPQKAFENWRAKFKAEPQPPARKLLYRRGGLSHRLSHTLSHSLSHMTRSTFPKFESYQAALSSL